MKNLIYILLLFPITLLGQNHSEQRTYEYDDLNRLIKVVFHNGESYEYIYDDLGNRTQITAVTEVELTYVPDDNFEQALIDLGYDSGALDDYVFTHNINDITVLYASSLGIQDATGIEDFTAIRALYINYNNIETIDISQNTQLKTIVIDNNNLTSIDVSNNSLLEYFSVGYNELTSIDVSNNSFLENLDVSRNELTTLDISNNSNIFFLSCDNNQISELELTYNVNLGILNAHYNAITNLDVNQNINLSNIWINNNPIETLDFSNNPNLVELNARNSEALTTLNVKNGNNNILTQFQSQNSPNLICIQVDNEVDANNGAGVYGDWHKDSFVFYSEDCDEPLTYVPDDNFEQALINLGYDAGALNNYVPTANINTITQLIINSKDINDLTGIEDFILLERLSCFGNSLSTLDMSQNSNLNYLNCEGNQLISIDISQNYNLIELSCDDNQLTDLNTSQNSNLEILLCGGNKLTSLDITNNNLLRNFTCDNNQITNINTSSLNTNLNYFLCQNNQLTSLDVNQYPNLLELYTDYNFLTELDISQNLNLYAISCISNSLNSLNIKNGNNSSFNLMKANNNPTLMCIQVDDEVSANNNIGVYSGWTVDTQVNYGEDCNIQIPDDLIITLYPNPTDNIIYINNPYGAELTQMMIINVLGQEIVNTDVIGSYIDFSNLVSGTYFVYLQDAEGSDITITVVKE